MWKLPIFGMLEWVMSSCLRFLSILRLGDKVSLFSSPLLGLMLSSVVLAGTPSRGKWSS